jgi:hypothetical protein
MSDALERIAREIDPMAWKAWEITSDIDTRKKVSIAKARSALLGIRDLDAAFLERAAVARLTGAQTASFINALHGL